MSDCPDCLHFKVCYLQNEQGTFELSVCAVNPAVPKVVDPEAHKGCSFWAGKDSDSIEKGEK